MRWQGADRRLTVTPYCASVAAIDLLQTIHVFPRQDHKTRIINLRVVGLQVGGK